MNIGVWPPRSHRPPRPRGRSPHHPYPPLLRYTLVPHQRIRTLVYLQIEMERTMSEVFLSGYTSLMAQFCKI